MTEDVVKKKYVTVWLDKRQAFMLVNGTQFIVDSEEEAIERVKKVLMFRTEVVEREISPNVECTSLK